MSEIEVWDSLPLIIKLRWYVEAFGYLMGSAFIALLISLVLYIKIDEWRRKP